MDSEGADTGSSRITLSRETVSSIVQDIDARRENSPAGVFVNNLKKLIVEYETKVEQGAPTSLAAFNYPDDGTCSYYDVSTGDVFSRAEFKVASSKELRSLTCNSVMLNVAALVANHERRCNLSAVSTFQFEGFATLSNAQRTIWQLSADTAADGLATAVREKILIRSNSPSIGKALEHKGEHTDKISELLADIPTTIESLGVEMSAVGWRHDADGSLAMTGTDFTEPVQAMEPIALARMGEIFSDFEYSTVIYEASTGQAIGGITPIVSPDLSPHIASIPDTWAPGANSQMQEGSIPQLSHVMYWDPSISDRDSVIDALLKQPRNTPVQEPFFDDQTLKAGNEKYSWFQFYNAPVDLFLSRHGLRRDDLDPSVRQIIEADGLVFVPN